MSRIKRLHFRRREPRPQMGGGWQEPPPVPPKRAGYQSQRGAPRHARSTDRLRAAGATEGRLHLEKRLAGEDRQRLLEACEVF